MSKKNFNKVVTKIISLAVLAIFTAFTSVNAQDGSTTVTIPGTGTGTISDALGACGNSAGNTRTVSFNVTGLTGIISKVSVNLEINHTRVGDVTARLASPGDNRQLVLFGQTGRVNSGDCGDTTNLNGVYEFSDQATNPNWWMTAASLGDDDIMPVGSYRTTASGRQPTANNSPETSFEVFNGTNPNGRWNLVVFDSGNGETGSITAANLTITTVPFPFVGSKRKYDFFGNGLSDFAVLSFPTGPSGGQVRWLALKNENPPRGGGTIFDIPFGQSSTDTIPNIGDYDGNGVTDLSVYRTSGGSPANTYFIQPLGGENQPNGTAYSFKWGNSATDIIGAEGDYDGDGKMDFTAVRDTNGVANPDGNLLWYVLRSSDNTVMYYYYGTDNDIVLPGADYTGDGADNPTVIRIAGSGQVFWIVGNGTTGTPISYTPWGDFNVDFVVPGGDYDGDGKADFMVWRGFGSGTNGVWYLRTAVGADSQVKFGIGGNSTTRDTALRGGDYDGDGRDDIAIYRPSTNTFWVSKSGGGVQIQQFGISGNTNIPVAGYGIF